VSSIFKNTSILMASPESENGTSALLEADKARLKEFFNIFDHNGDGTVDLRYLVILTHAGSQREQSAARLV
jgi:Ca2+-binding EF-hand superfamily protein